MNAEECVIGLSLRGPSELAEIRATGLAPRHFAQPAARRAWEAICQLADQKVEVDLVSMGTKLPGDDMPSLITWSTDAPVAQNPSHYAGEVLQAAWSRYLAREFSELAKDAINRQPFEGTEPLTARLSAIHRKAQDVGLGSSYRTMEPVDLAEKFMAHLDQEQNRHPIPTGLKSLDTVYGGLHAPDVTVIAARPGVGKTTLALNIATAADAAGFPTVFFTAEMHDVQILLRHVSAVSRVPGSHLRRAAMTDAQVDALSAAIERYKGGNLRINYAAARWFERVEEETRRLYRLGRCKVLVCDYLQLMRLEGKWETRTRELAEISWRLKGLANDLDIPIIAVAQLNREAERGPKGARLQLGYLKDCGAIEQDADNVIFLDHNEEEGTYELLCKKMRHGPSGRGFRVDAHLEISSFSDVLYNVEEPT